MTSPAALVRLIRPHQFIKNGFVFLPIFFGHRFTDLMAVERCVVAFLAFCLVSASVYVLNDIQDVEEDRAHPKKRKRPIAAGTVTLPAAWVTFAVCLAGAAAMSFALNWRILPFLGGYFVLNLAYSLGLKRVAVIDVFCIAVGFVLRVFAGGVAGNVAVSRWIVLMTFLLALFLALGKRRDDLLIEGDSTRVRKAISGYNKEMINASMVSMTAVIIVSYLMYAMSPDVTVAMGSENVYLTAFWVILGLFRYMQITFVQHESGSPTRILYRDWFLKLVLAGWLISFFLFIYVNTF